MPLFSSVPVMTFATVRRNLVKKQDPLQEAQWTELAGLSALAVNLHGNSFWADSVMGLLPREAIESLLAFLLSAHDLSQGQGEVNRCRNHSPKETGAWPEAQERSRDD